MTTQTQDIAAGYLENVREIAATPVEQRDTYALLTWGELYAVLDHIDALEGERDRYREALEWYADSDNYIGHMPGTVVMTAHEQLVCHDDGERARAALTGATS